MQSHRYIGKVARQLTNLSRTSLKAPATRHFARPFRTSCSKGKPFLHTSPFRSITTGAYNYSFVDLNKNKSDVMNTTSILSETPVSKPEVQTVAETPMTNSNSNNSTEPTVADVINSDQMLQLYLKQIYTGVGKALLTTASIGTLGVLAISSSPDLMFPILISGAITGIGSAAYLDFSKKVPTVTIDTKNMTITETNHQNRVIAANGVFIGTGLMSAPLLTIACLTTPAAIPMAGLLTAGATAGMIQYAMSKQDGALAKWGPALNVGIWSLIGANVGMMIFGYSDPMLWIENLAGIALFCGFTAYDFQRVVSEFKEKKMVDTLYNVTTFHLNIYNMFIRFLEIMMRLQKK